MTRFTSASILAVTAVLALAIAANGQAPGTGAIDGSVHGSTGAPIAEAHVSVVSESTGASRTVETTAGGFFAVPLLPPGSYFVSVAQSGFEAKQAHHILVSVGEATSLGFTVSILQRKETVEVSADAEIVQAQSSTLGRTVDEKAIESLPLANRNFTQILSLSPGVIVALPDATSLGRNTQNVTAVGNKTTANSLQFNGVNANNLAQNSAKDVGDEVGVGVPAPDTIQEFKVQTANYDAAYGQGTGANVDLVSRTGTNSFHGSVWEFVRNDIFNANLFFLKKDGQQRPALKQNQFGGAVGGPIFKDKTFFFGAYQGIRASNGVSPSSTATVLLPAITDDRSAATIGSQFCTSGPTFAGGVQLACDGSNINPVALKILNLKFADGKYAVPSPQVLLPPIDGQTPVGQSTFSIPASSREDQYTANLDHRLSPADQFDSRFFYSNDPSVLPFASANVPGWQGNQLDKNLIAVLGYTHVFSPALLNLARFGYSRFDGDTSIPSPFSASDIGSQSPQGESTADVPMPGVTVAGLFTIGNGGTPFQISKTNSFIWQDTVSMSRGRHTLRTGAEAKHHQVMVDPPFLISGFMETFTFNDFLIGQSAAQNGSPSGLSNLEITGANAGNFRKDERYNDFSSFIQDDVRISQKLSIFAGLRYEIFGAPTEKNGRLATFDPSTATLTAPSSGTFSGFVVPRNFPGAVPQGVQRLNRNGLWANNFADVSPRFGFALQVSDNPPVLLRGGYGIYYDRLSAGLVENLVNQPPFAQTQVLFDAQAGASSEQQPFNPLLPPASAYPLFVPRVAGGAQTLYPVDPNITDPYTQEYNLNLQTAFARDFLFEIGYVGTRALHLPGGVEFNQALLASPERPTNGETTNTVANITNRLPYAGLSTGSIVYQTRFPSNYNGLLASVTKRMSHGLQFLGSYTWSKSLDQTSGTNGSDVYEEWLLSNDQTNPRQAYGPTDFDRTHRGVISLVYEIPFSKAYIRSTGHLFNDWQVSAIAVAQSGSPLTITDNNAGAVYGNFENRAATPIANPMTAGSMFSRIQSGYLNRAAFPSAPMAPNGVSPSDTDFGDSSTGFLRGPGQRNIDIAVERSFALTESLRFHLRGEFFNLTNTPNFANPNVSLSSGQAFGTITSTASNPRIIQFAGKFSF